MVAQGIVPSKIWPTVVSRYGSGASDLPHHLATGQLVEAFVDLVKTDARIDQPTGGLAGTNCLRRNGLCLREKTLVDRTVGAPGKALIRQ